MIRKAWSALFLLVVAAIVIQVIAATIQPYLPTILTIVTIAGIAVLVVTLGVFVAKVTRYRRASSRGRNIL